MVLSANEFMELILGTRDYGSLYLGHPEAFGYPGSEVTRPNNLLWTMLAESYFELALCLSTIEKSGDWEAVLRGSSVVAWR